MSTDVYINKNSPNPKKNSGRGYLKSVDDKFVIKPLAAFSEVR